MGGFVGGLVRLTAAGVKATVVADCRPDVRVQCGPESALCPYRDRLARYERCTASQEQRRRAPQIEAPFQILANLLVLILLRGPQQPFEGHLC